MAGMVVTLPRRELFCCEGCRRIVMTAQVVTLDLPGGGWVVACTQCYDGQQVGRWRELPWCWNGECWLPKVESKPPHA
jgi:hypothetical protein